MDSYYYFRTSDPEVAEAFASDGYELIHTENIRSGHSSRRWYILRKKRDIDNDFIFSWDEIWAPYDEDSRA